MSEEGSSIFSDLEIGRFDENMKREVGISGLLNG